MSRDIFTYEEGGLTVIWKPTTCIHSKLCWRNLPGVFNPSKRPWVTLQGTAAESIIAQVKQCPSGALTYQFKDPAYNRLTEKSAELPGSSVVKVACMKNGPLLLSGKINIKNSDGTEEVKEGPVAFCRCGGSLKKPFCDGTHRLNGFTD